MFAQRNDARLMRLLREDRKIAWGLNNPVVVIIVSRKHRRTRLREREAPDEERLVFGGIGRMLCYPGVRFVELLLARRSHGRNPSVGRINDPRGAAIAADLVATVIPGFIVRAAEIRVGAAVAPVAIHFLAAVLRIRRNSFLRIEFLAAQLPRPFERRETGAVPDAFEIRMTVGSAGRR